jgi:heme/copper-type cytochrome/quinol oxidase subunit 2
MWGVVRFFMEGGLIDIMVNAICVIAAVVLVVSGLVAVLLKYVYWKSERETYLDREIEANRKNLINKRWGIGL